MPKVDPHGPQKLAIIGSQQRVKQRGRIVSLQTVALGGVIPPDVVTEIRRN